MPYRVVFRKEENGRSEIVINAKEVKFDEASGLMEFVDNKRMKIAFIPIDRILYIEKAED